MSAEIQDAFNAQVTLYLAAIDAEDNNAALNAMLKMRAIASQLLPVTQEAGNSIGGYDLAGMSAEIKRLQQHIRAAQGLQHQTITYVRPGATGDYA